MTDVMLDSALSRLDVLELLVADVMATGFKSEAQVELWARDRDADLAALIARRSGSGTSSNEHYEMAWVAMLARLRAAVRRRLGGG